jgi:hypothetical protein
VFGRLGAVILAVAVLVIAIRQFPAAQKWLEAVLPAPIVAFFEEKRDAPPIDQTLSRPVPAPVRAMDRALTPQQRSRRADSFGMGSSKQDVLAIQGVPSRRTDTTWAYGESQIFFASDRVVGWRTSDANPLRVK